MVKKSLTLYVSNSETESILLGHIRKQLLSAFKQVSDALQTRFDEQQRTVVACPSQEQINLLIGVV